jgi:hypothetical protein
MYKDYVTNKLPAAHLTSQYDLWAKNTNIYKHPHTEFTAKLQCYSATQNIYIIPLINTYNSS